MVRAITLKLDRERAAGGRPFARMRLASEAKQDAPKRLFFIRKQLSDLVIVAARQYRRAEIELKRADMVDVLVRRRQQETSVWTEPLR
jgi:hypothetical protein